MRFIRSDFLNSSGNQRSEYLLNMELAHTYQIPGSCYTIDIDEHKYHRQVSWSRNIFGICS